MGGAALAGSGQCGEHASMISDVEMRIAWKGRIRLVHAPLSTSSRKWTVGDQHAPPTHIWVPICLKSDTTCSNKLAQEITAQEHHHPHTDDYNTNHTQTTAPPTHRLHSRLYTTHHTHTSPRLHTDHTQTACTTTAKPVQLNGHTLRSNLGPRY